MRWNVSYFVVWVAVGTLVFAEGDVVAGRPGELGDRHFRKSVTGPGILAGRIERRKAARAGEQRQRAASQAERPSAKPRNNKKVPAPVEKASEAGERKQTRAKPTETPQRVKQRSPGRGGKGTGPSVRRRVVLEPLFGG